MTRNVSVTSTGINWCNSFWQTAPGWDVSTGLWCCPFLFLTCSNSAMRFAPIFYQYKNSTRFSPLDLRCSSSETHATILRCNSSKEKHSLPTPKSQGWRSFPTNYSNEFSKLAGNEFCHSSEYTASQASFFLFNSTRNIIYCRFYNAYIVIWGYSTCLMKHQQIRYKYVRFMACCVPPCISFPPGERAVIVLLAAPLERTLKNNKWF